jgi:hypothetical protein
MKLKIMIRNGQKVGQREVLKDGLLRKVIEMVNIGEKNGTKE